MQTGEWVQIITSLGVIVSGLFALVRWLDQRKRELAERRFEQYWKLVDVCLETPKLGKQKTALLLLKRFPEYREETIAFLTDAKTRGDPWANQNAVQIDDILQYFASQNP